MFHNLIGCSSRRVPNFSLSTNFRLMKFSMALLSTRAISSAVPLNKCMEIGSSSLFELLNQYTVRRHKVLAKAASSGPRQSPSQSPSQSISALLPELLIARPFYSLCLQSFLWLVLLGQRFFQKHSWGPVSHTRQIRFS